MNNEIVRDARGKDLPELLRLISTSNLSRWSRADLGAEIGNPNGLVLVFGAADKSGVLGFVHGRIIPSSRAEGGNEVEICNIAVDANVRGKGIGRTLLTEFLRRCSEFSPFSIHLEVRASNLNAVRFYEKHGFVRNGTRKSFYRDPDEDAMLMSRTLKA